MTDVRRVHRSTTTSFRSVSNWCSLRRVVAHEKGHVIYKALFRQAVDDYIRCCIGKLTFRSIFLFFTAVMVTITITRTGIKTVRHNLPLQMPALKPLTSGRPACRKAAIQGDTRPSHGPSATFCFSIHYILWHLHANWERDLRFIGQLLVR